MEYKKVVNSETKMESVEKQRELWLEKLAQLLDKVEEIEQLYEELKSDKDPGRKKLAKSLKTQLYEFTSIYKLMNLMMMNDQWDMDTTEVRKVRRVIRVHKYIPNYILDVNEIDRVVSGGLFTELNVWILPEDAVEKARHNRWNAILEPEKYGLPALSECNYATLIPFGTSGYLALSKDNGIFNDYIQYARNIEYPEMEL